MYDDDLFSLYNSYTQTTDEDEEVQSSASSYNPSSYNQTYNPYDTDTSYRDDYSVTPNYEEQQSYESSRQTVQAEEQTTRVFQKMDTPMIQREEQAVVLTKTKQKIYLHARMKIVLAMFVSIVCALMFVSIFNFVSVGKINAAIADKEIQIAELQASISELQTTYNQVSDDGYIREKLTDSENGLNFVDSSEHTEYLKFGDVYTEPVVEDLPSNWFNDVCDFLSGLFAA